MYEKHGLTRVLALQGSKTRHTNLIRPKSSEGDVTPHFQFLTILFSGAISLRRVVITYPKIVMNLPRIHESYIVKENHIG